MLEVRLLGQYEVKRDGEPVEIASRPSRLLLAYLALTVGKRHPRARLAGLLWPNSDELNARSNLRQALWRLRKSVGEEYLLTDNRTVALNPGADYWIDTGLLLDGTGKNLTEAVGVYEGELLPGYYEEWVLLEREQLRSIFEARIQSLLDQLAQQKLWPDVVRWAERWIALGQVPEPAYRALMVAHAALGNLAALKAAYQRCLSDLQLEVGVEPSEETRRLHDQLLQGKGELATNYLTTGERPIQNAPRHNLIQESTPFIGRESESAQIKDLLTGTRLVTIVGPGGTGKTRLAITVALELIDSFRNGVYFISLAPVESPDQIVQTIAETIGFPLSTYEDPKQQLLRHLRHRHYLLLLDNFEHLLAGAGLVSEMIQHAGALRLLITSRERLNLKEETLFHIEGLVYPASTLPSDALHYSAVRLFIDSAERVSPGFTLRPANISHIVRICQLLEGMPLAILLAAAWANVLTPEEIEAAIVDSLDLLDVDWPDVPRRHRSVRAAFKPSWRRLTDAQRSLYAGLSVFTGGFAREAVEAVADASITDLSDLVNKSLLRRELETGRYQMHELWRQYAQERLEALPETRDALMEAHATYFAEAAQRQWHQLISDEAETTLAGIGADLENLRQAWRYWLDRLDAGRVRMFVDFFWRVYDLLGWFNTGEKLFRTAAETLRAAGEASADVESQVLYARLLGHQAYFLAQMGYTDAGLGQAKESVEILRRAKRPWELVYPLTTLQWTASYVDDPKQAMNLDLNEIEFADEPDSQWQRAFVYCWQGRGAAWRGEIEPARRQLEESLTLFESLRDNFATVWPRLELGNLAVSNGSFAEARKHYEQVFSSAQDSGFAWAIVKAARYLGNIATILGEFQKAESYLRTSLRISDELGLIRDVVSTLYDLAVVEAASGNMETAVRILAVVHQHPLSDQTRSFSVWRSGPVVRIRELADARLSELRSQITSEAYAAAQRDGRGSEFETVVVQLLSS